MNVRKLLPCCLLVFCASVSLFAQELMPIDDKVYAIEDGMVHVFNDDFPDSIEVNTGEDVTHGLFYSEKEYGRFIFRFQFSKMSLPPKVNLYVR